MSRLLFHSKNLVSKNQQLIKQRNDEIIMDKVTALYENVDALSQVEFYAVTEICALPRYMNLALFRAMEQNDVITLEQFKENWDLLTKDYDYSDPDSLIYHILKKPEFNCITPDDFLPVLEDIVLNHPALQFLENNVTFQERYIETVICRIFYDAQCPTGKLTLKQYCKTNFSSILKSLDPTIDLYAIHNIFSYKQFYVLYCKLWSLDTDHDLSISESDLSNYNMGTLTGLTVERIMENGRIAAFTDSQTRTEENDLDDNVPYLTYFDFIWFFLSEIDKSTPLAIVYWFRCLDVDGDGVLSAYELYKFWQDQDTKQNFFGNPQVDGTIQFEDIIRQMNDLIQPDVPGQFSLKDLRKNGYLAERFFDTFINYDRFQVHEAHQEGSIRQQKLYEQKQWQENETPYDSTILKDDLGFPVLCHWNDYADIEYTRIIADENYANSYEDDQEDDSLMGCQLGEDDGDDEGIIMIPCIDKQDFITETSSGDDENGLSDTLSISSTTSSRSEANTPDLHDADYLQETTSESEITQDDALNSSLYNLGKNSLGLSADLSDCLHQHINN
ncbi:uncharacterized protein EV154DRAFT_568064 [Mucor mucedo]|uniref:uncharacterized protein n=1 Tax=Mucor mucedo TaxID=29922 RepID=UPI00221FD21A|nr:uncharacterized protein EV154DRAFT_568064 [Mucor mucedo]KAI7883383.1 hypothetical protein EV154DRAFT_568064 [Mucor mucedo]